MKKHFLDQCWAGYLILTEYQIYLGSENTPNTDCRIYLGFENGLDNQADTIKTRERTRNRSGKTM